MRFSHAFSSVDAMFIRHSTKLHAVVHADKLERPSLLLSELTSLFGFQPRENRRLPHLRAGANQPGATLPPRDLDIVMLENTHLNRKLLDTCTSSRIFTQLIGLLLFFVGSTFLLLRSVQRHVRQITATSSSALVSSPTLRLGSITVPCQATCVTGNFRSFDEKKLQSIRQNTKMVSSDCHHMFLVGSVGSIHTKIYLSKEVTTAAGVKDEDLADQHRVKNDFVNKESDYSSTLGNSTDLVIVKSTAGQQGKYEKCMELVRNAELSQNSYYSVLAKIRPDALWYAPVSNFIKLTSQQRLVTSHADTAWFGLHTSHYMTNRNLTKMVEMTQRWYPTKQVKFKYVPWVLCRSSGKVGTLFNYVDSFLHGDVAWSKYGQFCYRMYQLYGTRIYGREQNRIDFPFEGQTAVKEWLDNGTPPCDVINYASDEIPMIKHDVEICNHWEPVCRQGNCTLSIRSLNLYAKLRTWSATAIKAVSMNVSQCVHYIGSICDMLVALQYISIAVNKPAAVPPATGRVRQAVAEDRACLNAREIAAEISRANDGPPNLTQKKFDVCRPYIEFDWYYWAPRWVPEESTS